MVEQWIWRNFPDFIKLSGCKVYETGKGVQHKLWYELFWISFLYVNYDSFVCMFMSQERRSCVSSLSFALDQQSIQTLSTLWNNGIVDDSHEVHNMFRVSYKIERNVSYAPRQWHSCSRHAVPIFLFWFSGFICIKNLGLRNQLFTVLILVCSGGSLTVIYNQ